jgi:hypothetical protein
MATIDSLVGNGLVRVTVPLGPTDGETIRRVFAFPELDAWIRADVPNLQIEAGAALSPKEELDDLLFNYISSKGQLRYDKMFKDLMPASDEIWELKTWQLRIFGWFCRKDDFVGVFGKRKVEMKPRGAYDEAKARVIAARNALPLDAPKFVGGTIKNVISGF